MDSVLVEGIQNAGTDMGWSRPISVLGMGPSSHRAHRQVLFM